LAENNATCNTTWHTAAYKISFARCQRATKFCVHIISTTKSTTKCIAMRQVFTREYTKEKY